MPSYVIDEIKELNRKTSLIAEEALEPVRNDDETYFEKFNIVITKPWTISKPHRKLDSSLRWEIPQYKAKLGG